MFLFVYSSSYQLILSFPHLVVILKTLGTPIFCFNNNIMNDNSKQDHQGKNKFGRTLFAELRGRDTRALPRIFRLFLIPKKNPYSNQATQKNTCQIFLPKKIPESKISNPKKSFDHPRHLKSGVPPPPPWAYVYSTRLLQALRQWESRHKEED